MCSLMEEAEEISLVDVTFVYLRESKYPNGCQDVKNEL